MDLLKEESIMYELMEIDEIVDAISEMAHNWNYRGARALDNVDTQIQNIIKELKEDLDGEQQEEKKGQ